MGKSKPVMACQMPLKPTQKKEITRAATSLFRSFRLFTHSMAMKGRIRPLLKDEPTSRKLSQGSMEKATPMNIMTHRLAKSGFTGRVRNTLSFQE